jgi:hypothetical protein
MVTFVTNKTAGGKRTMPDDPEFELSDFTPYLLNAAAEAQSLRFSRVYKDRYGMLRTEWRVLFHLGRYGAMSAREILAARGHPQDQGLARRGRAGAQEVSRTRRRPVPRIAGSRSLICVRRDARPFADLSNGRRPSMNAGWRRGSGTRALAELRDMLRRLSG